MNAQGPNMNFHAKVRKSNGLTRSYMKRCYIGYLNVRTLRQSRTIKKGKLHSRDEDKIDYYKDMMRENGLYVLAMSEVRRNDSGEEDVGDDFIFVWQGRCDDGSRGGVAFLLSPEAAKAWRKGGSVSNSSDSGRILALNFKLGGNEGSWGIISVYGPTSQCSTDQKDRFWNELQETYDFFSKDQIVHVIGDFNARVGSRRQQDCSDIQEAIGPHGLGKRNENGERLINFCIANKLRVEHTFHKHKTSQKATWFHPRFGTPGVIDMALVQREHAKHAADIRVLPSVDTRSDHKLCRMKLIQCPDGVSHPVDRSVQKRGQGRPPRLPVDMNNEDFAKAVDHALRELDDLEEAQRRIRTLAEECFRPDPTQTTRPQWQKDNQQRLKQLSEERRRAFAEFQQKQTDEARRAYRQVCNKNRKSVRRMVAKWWDNRLHDMEVAAEHGDSRALHQGVKGLLDFIADEGQTKKALSKNHKEDQAGMTKHFRDILNVERKFDPSILESAPDFRHIGELVDWSEPNEDDVRWAIMHLKNNKAADSLGLQAEMYKACVKNEKNGETCELVRLITLTVQKLWRGDDVPESWLDSILIPLYKRKGARKDWNNWRGIVLLNIASKVHAILLNRNLQDLSDKLVPETQVGFRPEHGSADGLLVVRRILECFRSMKGADKGVYLLFVDLKKAFDAVPRSILWYLLEKKCGVPINVVTAIRKLHDGMSARTLYRGELGESFEMSTGVRQGSIEGPSLWNIFYTFLLLDWGKRCKERLGEGGVTFEYTLDGQLRTAEQNAQRSAFTSTISDLEYADDLVVFETDPIRFSEAAKILDETCTDWGAEIHPSKTKWMYVSPDLNDDFDFPEVMIRAEKVEQVHEFVYLGNIVGDSYSLGIFEDVTRRVAEATKIFGRLKPIWQSRKLPRNIKRRLFLVCVGSTLLYGCENWPLPEAACHLIHKFWYSRIRSILGISWVRMRDYRITNERCLEMLGVPDWRVLVGRRYTRWLGHVARMAPTRLARQTLFGFAKGRLQSKTGRRRNLISHAKATLRGLPELDMRIWAHTAQDKSGWNNLCTTWSNDAPEFIIDDPQKCPICGQQVIKNLGKHISTKHAVSNAKFQCTVSGCSETFNTKNARTRHLAKKHGIEPPKPFPCPHDGCTCGPFQTNGHLLAHLKRKHPPANPP